MRHRPMRRLGGASALAAVMGACVLVIGCTEDPPAAPPEEATPQAGPSPEPTPEPTPEDEEPTDREAGAREDLRTIAEQVSAIRGLELIDEIDIEVVTSGELAEIVADRDQETEALERLAAASQVLTALRHIEPDDDLGAIVEELQQATVAGLYDPEDGLAYVSGDELPLGPAARTTAAHELLHALQDQHFDLTRIADIADEDADAALAFLSVVEGDAVILEEEWAATYQEEDERAAAEQERLEGARAQLEVLDGTPPYIIESFVFPYVAGERFVVTLVEEGGHDAINAALEEPPTTTLEILDPQAYLDGLEIADVSAGEAPEAGFEEIYRASFGAFDLLALFGAADSPGAQGGSAAWTGWRGGSIAAWEAGADVVVSAAWRFEDVERAETVCAALPEWYRDVADGTGGEEVLESEEDVLVIHCEATSVRFALGPTADLASASLDEG